MINYPLTIELVPETSWYNNLRKVISQKDWDVLRKQVYHKYNYHCGICNATGMMNCHELWEYDDVNHIQYLKGFIALCTLCHHCKHVGLARILADQGKLNYNDVITHFCTVNHCNPFQMDRYVQDAFILWESRSNYLWKIDLGEHRNLYG